MAKIIIRKGHIHLRLETRPLEEHIKFFFCDTEVTESHFETIKYHIEKSIREGYYISETTCWNMLYFKNADEYKERYGKLLINRGD